VTLVQPELPVVDVGGFELAWVRSQAQALTAEVKRLRSELSWVSHQRDLAVEDRARAEDAYAALVERHQGLLERVRLQSWVLSQSGSTSSPSPSPSPSSPVALAAALAREVPAGAGLAAAVHTAIGNLAELSTYAQAEADPVSDPVDDAESVTESWVGSGGSAAGSGPVVPVLSAGGVDLPDALLVDVAAAGHRLAEWANLASVMATDELARRRESEQPFPDKDDERGLAELGFRSAVAEVAAVCGVSEHGVRHRIELVRELPDRLPSTWDRVVRGELDLAKARVLHEQTLHLDEATARRVEHQLLDLAAGLTWSQLRVRTERLAARLDPAAHADLVASCVRTSTGVRFGAPGPGLGSMTVTAPAPDIEAARRALEVLTEAADTSDPTARGPAALPGHVNRADVLLGTLVAAAEQFTRNAPAVISEAASARPVAGQPSLRPARRAQIRITVPFSVLAGPGAGADAAVGELDGYGPVPAAMLHELIATHGEDATWQCLILDDRPGSPLHGTVLGIGKSTCTPRYTPGPLTRALVEARHGTCRFPGCRRRAEACDLDHRLAHGAGGATCDCNLHPLCRHHHRLKNGPSPFIPIRVGRQTRWVTPTGRTLVAHDDDPPF